MSDFSLTLVLQIKTSKNHQWHGKGKHEIWENHSFWRNISREGAFFPFCGSGYRQSPGTSVYIVRLSKREIVCSLSHEQWLRMGKTAIVLHGREHCVPSADSTHTQLLQVPHGQDRRKSLRTKEDQPHQSLRIQVHQRASQVDKDVKALSDEYLHGQQIISEPFPFTDG